MDQLEYRNLFQSKIHRIVTSGYAGHDDFVGLSASEISDVELSQGVTLPKAYVSFLEVMGKRVGPLFGGSNVTFPDILWFRAEATRIASEAEVDIASMGVIFLIHQGYDVLFLGTHSDDPEVYRFTDSTSRPERVSESFTAFFGSEVEQLLTSRRFNNRRSSALTMEEIRGLIAQRDARRHQS